MVGGRRRFRRPAGLSLLGVILGNGGVFPFLLPCRLAAGLAGGFCVVSPSSPGCVMSGGGREAKGYIINNELSERSQIFSTCVHYRKQWRFRYRRSTFFLLCIFYLFS